MYLWNANYSLLCSGLARSGMSITEIIDDFPELTEEDIRVCLEFVADRNHRLVALVSSP